MDFDHVRGLKEGEISQLVYTAGEERLRSELDKCDVVCANCHRIRTSTRRDEGPAADVG